MKVAIVAAVLLVAPCLGFPATIYVPDDHAKIQDAIDAAAAGDTVIVRAGTYFENIDFLGKAITVRSEQGPMATIIDGGRADSVVKFTQGERPNSVLRGFTITHGNAPCGGGIYCIDASPTIAGNIITRNSAICDPEGGNGGGGGIFLYQSYDAVIAGNIITENIVKVYTRGGGGGIYAGDYSRPKITGNTISRNSVEMYGLLFGHYVYGGGGGIYLRYRSTPDIADNLISENTSDHDGGGIYIEDANYSYITTLSGNVISRNRASGSGGGIYSRANSYEGPGAIIADSVIRANSAESGGGIYSAGNPVIARCVISNNTAVSRGGGVQAGGPTNYDWADITLADTTFYGNTAEESGGGIDCHMHSIVTARNLILWSDDAPVGPEIALLGEQDSEALLSIAFSSVQGGQSSVSVGSYSTLNWGSGMSHSDPKFVLPEKEDFRLLWKSECIDTGDPSYSDPDGTRTDIGAHFFDQRDELTIYLSPDPETVGRPVARGDRLDVTYTVINRRPQPKQFRYATELTLPDGSAVNLVGPVATAMQGETTRQLNFSHDLPGGAMMGRYTYSTRIGLSSQVFDEDAFGLIVFDHPVAEFSIQEAIDEASAGDVIFVPPGTYYENIDFKGKAVTVKSEQGPEATVIDGLMRDTVVTFANGEGRDSVLEGFTIAYGNAIYGGGIHCFQASPTISDNVITGSFALFYGGAIFCKGDPSQGADPLISGNSITGNSAYDFGGGIHCEHSSPLITGNILTGNTANDTAGGAISCTSESSPVIERNRIDGNHAYRYGGGIHCKDGSAATITGNEIRNNTSEQRGAGISCSHSDASIIDNVITGNVVSDDLYNHRDNPRGGGIHCGGFSLVISGNIICDNSAVGEGAYGGGIDCSGADYALITNNVIWNNAATGAYADGGGVNCGGSYPIIGNNVIWGNAATGYKSTGGGVSCFGSSHVTVVNSIVWNNQATHGDQLSLTAYSSSVVLSISHSDVEGGQGDVYTDGTGTIVLDWGNGMIDTDPLFVDPANGDFHLTWPSPCRDAGDDSAVTVTEDFEGDPRIFHGGVDMGADEFHYRLYHVGAVIPGQAVNVRVIGGPGMPTTLIQGSGVQDPPQSTPVGDLYLELPIVDYRFVGKVPADGVLKLDNAPVPGFWIPGEERPFQALVGPQGGPRTQLTNLMLLKVE